MSKHLGNIHVSEFTESSLRESAALGHFSVSIFFGQVHNKVSKRNIVISQYNSLALW